MGVSLLPVGLAAAATAATIVGQTGQPPGMASPVADASRLIVAGAFGLAACHKLRNLRASARDVSTMPGLSLLLRKPRHSYLFVRVLAIYEALLAISLLVGVADPLILPIVAATLMAFTMQILAAIAAGRTQSCGCFASRSRQERLGAATIVRNLSLLALVGTIGNSTLFDPAAAMPLRSGGSTVVVFSTAVVAAAGIWVLSKRQPILVMSEASGRKRSRQPKSYPSTSAPADPYFADYAAQSPSDSERLYRLAREHNAAAVTALLAADELLQDHISNRILDRPLEREKVDAIKAADASILQLERNLDSVLEQMYGLVTETVSSGDVRNALLHWTACIRRLHGEALHTLVPGLEADEDCRGDLIADDLLQRYFDALFDVSSDESAVQAVMALAALARQSACLGAQQSAAFASSAYQAFVEVSAYLRTNEREHVLPAVVHAAMNPLLLFHDVEKHRGFASPLARWFTENEAILIEGARTRRLPASWHGLWLYDRQTGQLVGYRDRPLDGRDTENDVVLTEFVRSLNSAENMGELNCAFTEVIERGVTPIGYLCTGKPCSKEAAKDQGRRRDWAQTLRSRLHQPRPPKAKAVSGEESKASASTGTTTCSQTRSDDCQNRGGTHGLRNRATAELQCLTASIIQPDKEFVECMAEATGRCANPKGMAAKDMVAAVLVGVKVGKDCQLSHDKSGKKYPDTAYELKHHWYKEKSAREQLEAAKQDQEQAREEIEKQKTKQAEAQAQVDAVLDGPDENVSVSAGVEGKGVSGGVSIESNAADKLALAEGRLKRATERLAAAKEQEKKAAKAVVESQAALDKAKGEYNQAKKKYDDEQAKKAKQQKMCPPDALDCGDNNCTALAQAADRTMECTRKALQAGRQPPPLKLSGDIDPSPLDDPAAGSWNDCLSFSGLSPTNRQCWATHCGPGLETVHEGGKCRCTDRPAAPATTLKSLCHALDCGDGSIAVVRGHSCSCEPEGGRGAVPGSRPPGTIVSPPTWLEVRGRELNAVEQRRLAIREMAILLETDIDPALFQVLGRRF